MYMLWRFGRAFVDGYILNENLKLFATPMYGGQPGWYFYLSIVLVGMLPWTGLLVARGWEAIRPGDRSSGRPDLPDVLLWSWIVAIVVFFSLSQFKLDHYVFPTSPALCLVCARGWHEARNGAARTPTWWGLRLVGPTLIGAGLAMVYAAWQLLDLPPGFLVVPAVLIAAGILTMRTIRDTRVPVWPVAPVIAMATVYAGALLWVMPKLEAGKVVPDVAHWVAAHAGPDDRVATFRLNRWNTAYRFYVGREVTAVESDDEARRFFSEPTPYFIVMTGMLYDALRAAGVPMQIAYEREGRWVTSGRALWRRVDRGTRFIVAVQAPTGNGP
ncbi:MAG: hypothetical protein QM736_15495 [Vicinamibacterales bacterium]